MSSATTTGENGGKFVKAEHLAIDPPFELKCNKPNVTLKYAVVSFVSPENRIQQRFIHDANRFLYHDVNKQIIDTTTNLARNVNTEFDNLLEKKIKTYKSSKDQNYKMVAEILESCRQEVKLNEDEQVTKTLRTYKIDQDELHDRFETYKVQNAKELETEFTQKFGDETSVRGFKIRSAHDDENDAKAFAKKAHQSESVVNTFIAPFGYWVPWDPNADAVQDQDYMVKELNDLMAKKKLNEEQRDEYFQKRKQMMMDSTEKDNSKELKDTLHQRLQQLKEHRNKK